jgi:hypothetical protein
MSRFQIPKPPRGVSKCPPPVCPPPVCPPCIQGVGGRPPRVGDPVACPQCDSLRLLSVDYVSSVEGIKAYWVLLDQRFSGYSCSLQLSSDVNFDLDSTYSYAVSTTANANGIILNTLNLGQIPSNIEYARVAIILDASEIKYSNVVPILRIQLHSFSYNLVSGSDTGGTISVDLSVNSQLYAMNNQVNIETASSTGATTSQPIIMPFISVDRGTTKGSGTTPQNVVFFSPPAKARLFIIIRQGTPDERIYYSNYLVPTIRR